MCRTIGGSRNGRLFSRAELCGEIKNGKSEFVAAIGFPVVTRSLTGDPASSSSASEMRWPSDVSFAKTGWCSRQDESRLLTALRAAEIENRADSEVAFRHGSDAALVRRPRQATPKRTRFVNADVQAGPTTVRSRRRVVRSGGEDRRLQVLRCWVRWMSQRPAVDPGCPFRARGAFGCSDSSEGTT